MKIQILTLHPRSSVPGWDVSLIYAGDSGQERPTIHNCQGTHQILTSCEFQHPNIIISHVQATHHWLTDLRSLALIVALLLRTQIDKPRHASMPALSNEMSSDGAGFNDLGRLLTPIFLLICHFFYRFSTFSEKMEKIHHRIPLL